MTAESRGSAYFDGGGAEVIFALGGKMKSRIQGADREKMEPAFARPVRKGGKNKVWAGCYYLPKGGRKKDRAIRTSVPRVKQKPSLHFQSELVEEKTLFALIISYGRRTTGKRKST